MKRQNDSNAPQLPPDGCCTDITDVGVVQYDFLEGCVVPAKHIMPIGITTKTETITRKPGATDETSAF
jgi:hypothetical protein